MFLFISFLKLWQQCRSKERAGGAAERSDMRTHKLTYTRMYACTHVRMHLIQALLKITPGTNKATATTTTTIKKTRGKIRKIVNNNIYYCK